MGKPNHNRRKHKTWTSVEPLAPQKRGPRTTEGSAATSRIPTIASRDIILHMGHGCSVSPVWTGLQRMSAVTKPQAPPSSADDADRFRYGWRNVFVRNPDGTKSLEQLPLTREDALHPEPGDFIVHSDPHTDDMVYFKSVFKALLKHDPSAVVLVDWGVDWRLRGIKHVCPDIAVFFDVDIKKWRRTEPIFYVKALHARTALVIEVTSKSTRSNDLKTKVGYYHRCRVPVYIIVDATIEERGQRKLKLIGHRYAPAGYERIAPNERDWIWI